MKFIVNIRESFLNLITSKLRSFLAILGILVGTGSVVALISSSQLATEHALAQFKSLGTNLLLVNIQNDPLVNKQDQVHRLTLADMNILKSVAPQIVQIAPYTNTYKTFEIAGMNVSGQVLGATLALANIAKIKIKQGRFVSFLDKENFFCVVGSKLAHKIAHTGAPVLGNQIQIGKSIFTIIGVAKPWRPSLFFYADIDNGVIVPLQSSYMFGKEVQISNLLIRLIQQPDLPLVQKVIKAKLKQIVPGKKVYFHNPQQIINAVSAQRQTFTWLLAAIGGISLLVGGIGVMNIMLVSVVERRREIGIRMAIGAKPKDILNMFLIEALMLTMFGGLVGVISGVVVSYVIAHLSKWAFTLYLLPPLLGFIVSAIVGVVSGFYPAFRASRLDPIQTLQSD